MSKVIELQNQIAAIRSNILSLQLSETGHNLSAQVERNQKITQLRSQLSPLEDALYVAKMTEGFSAVQKPQQQKRSHKLSNYHLRRLFTGGVVEARDIFTNTSGIVVPEIYQQWVAATRWTSPLVGMVTRYDRVGQPQQVKTSIVDNTAATMSYTVEGASTGSTSTDPTITVEINGSDVILSKLRYSIQIENDAFEFQNLLTTVAAQRVSRGLSYVLTNGKDEGTGTALPNNVTGGLLASAAVAGTAAASNAISYADLVTTLKASLDESYRTNGVFLMSQAAHDLLEAAVDGESRPLYKHDSEGYLLIAGQRAYINSAMVFTSGKPAVLYGDFSKAIGFLDGGSRFRVNSEAPGLIEQLERELLIYSRVGSTPLLSTAVKSLTAH